MAGGPPANEAVTATDCCSPYDHASQTEVHVLLQTQQAAAENLGSLQPLVSGLSGLGAPDPDKGLLARCCNRSSVVSVQQVRATWHGVQVHAAKFFFCCCAAPFLCRLGSDWHHQQI